MADSDKIITVTPNTSVATTHPEIKFVGKDNSPMYIKTLDDNTLSFEGAEGQVFSISPTLASGDIFSVNDISGVQSIAVNADGTITLDAQTKATTITNNASNASTLILQNTNVDAERGPQLEFYRNSASPADADKTGTIIWYGNDDGGNKQELGQIYMYYNDVSNSSEDSEMIFQLTEAGGVQQEYFRIRGGSRQISFNTAADDIDMTWDTDSTADFMFWDASTQRVGINTGSSVETTFHVNGTIQSGEQTGSYWSSLESNSLNFNRNAASYIQQKVDNGDIRFRMNAANTDLMMLDGSTMRVGIGTTAPGGILDIHSTSGNQLRLSYDANWYWILERDSNGDLNFTNHNNTTDVVAMHLDAATNRAGIGTTAPSSTLEVAGDLVARRTEIIDISSNTNLSGNSNAGRLLRCTSACTLSLQASPTAGEQQIIYNDSTGTITIAANGSDTINGSTNDVTITTRYKAVTVIAVSTSAWLAIGA